MMVGMSTAMAEASYGGLCNTVKPLTNEQTVRGRPTPKDDDERAFRVVPRTLGEYLKCCNQVHASSKEIN